MKKLLFLLTLTIIVLTANAQDNNIIKTNATCTAGQDRIIRELKQLDGVFEVKFAADGTITLDYSSDGTSLNDIIQKITECGFTANGKTPAKGDKNLCNAEIKVKTKTIK